MEIKCPICKKEFEYSKGLAGHLKFKHKLTGEAFKNAYQQGGVMLDEKAIARAKTQSEINLISNLHSQLKEVREKRKEVDEQLDTGGWFSTDKAAERLKKLYDREEKRIEAELKALLGDDSKSDDDTFPF